MLMAFSLCPLLLLFVGFMCQTSDSETTTPTLVHVIGELFLLPGGGGVPPGSLREGYVVCGIPCSLVWVVWLEWFGALKCVLSALVADGILARRV